MGRGIVLWLGLYALWLVLSGLYTPLFLALGAGAAGLTVILSARLGLLDREGVPLEFGLRFLGYWGWLAGEIAKANLAMARLILSPRSALDPQIVRWRATQHGDLGRATFANSITLTPGTVTLDIEGEEMVVHAIVPAMGDAAGGAEMDRRVTRLERAAGAG